MMYKPTPPSKPTYIPFRRVVAKYLYKDGEFVKLNDILNEIPEQYRDSAGILVDCYIGEGGYNDTVVCYNIPNDQTEYNKQVAKYEKELDEYNKKLEEYEIEQALRVREEKIKQYEKLKEELGL